jgi:hypothetical protein
MHRTTFPFTRIETTSVRPTARSSAGSSAGSSSRLFIGQRRVPAPAACTPPASVFRLAFIG